MNQFMKRLSAFAVLVSLLACLCPTGSASASGAANITAKCKFSPSSNTGSFKKALDDNYRTAWSSGKAAARFVDFTVQPGYPVGGIYLVWNTMPDGWELFSVGSGGKQTSVAKGGSEGYLAQYVLVPEKFSDCKKFRLALYAKSTADVKITDLSVYTPGSPPYYAPMWQPFTGRAELLTIVAHPDDDDLYLSMPAVTYANDGRKCATVLMTYGNNAKSPRRLEALESMWSLGDRSYPVLGRFPDVKVSKAEAIKLWNLDKTVGFIVMQIRRFKPSVIVTHDVRGEYGHGEHMLTEYATQLAFQCAGDSSKYPDSAKKFGTWKPGKLYVHLYKQNPLKPMSLTKKLRAFGNLTVREAIARAYARQRSQLPGRSLPVSGHYDMRLFGLFYTNLGADKAHQSMFENVTEDAMLKLNPWYNVVVVNRAALAKALGDARSKKEADYTPESWAIAALPEKIAAAQAVLDNKLSTQAQVTAQAEALNDAMSQLVEA
jgi:LmbE family N-acetylglucosaminyl deacetylase